VVAGSNPAGPAIIRTDCSRLDSGINTGINTSTAELLSQFRDFCRIDRNLSERTVSENNGYPFQIRRFLESVGKDPTQVTADDIRSFLSKFQDRSASTRANILKALKVFFRDFMKMPQVVESFKFPKRTYTPKTVPSKEDLKRFFDALETDRDRALFLLFASSGLRRSEVLSLSIEDLDPVNRMIVPKNHKSGTTKNAWVSFCNQETEPYLKDYLRSLTGSELCPFGETVIRKAFKKASQESGVKITPQVLREWFCCQLGELGVPDRYVDALCGRTPKSVLARHYTDYSPIKLKTIYDRVGLRILS